MKDSSLTSPYNQEPIYYCKHCLSLKVLNDTRLTDLEYCDECGSTHIEETDIHTWRGMYKQRYGFDYLEK